MLHSIIRRTRAAGLAATLLGALASAGAGAEQPPQPPINLRSHDGSVSISGRLLAFEDGVYVIDASGLGVLRIDSADVDCRGPLCPPLKARDRKSGARDPRGGLGAPSAAS